jgi:carbonic anhydrase
MVVSKAGRIEIDRSFLELQQQALRFRKAEERPSLWIVCTDRSMDPVVDRIRRAGPVLVMRRPGSEVPADETDLQGELSAINFAVERIGVHSIVVCGHSMCSIGPCDDDTGYRESVSPSGGGLLQRVHHREAKNDRLRAHLVRQLQVLESYPSVAHAMGLGELRLHATFYLAESGHFTWYDEQYDRFVALNAPGTES